MYKYKVTQFVIEYQKDKLYYCGAHINLFEALEIADSLDGTVKQLVQTVEQDNDTAKVIFSTINKIKQ